MIIFLILIFIKATDPYQFQESMLDGVLYLIGGNHVVKACKELLEEEKENEEFRSYRYICEEIVTENLTH